MGHYTGLNRGKLSLHLAMSAKQEKSRNKSKVVIGHLAAVRLKMKKKKCGSFDRNVQVSTDNVETQAYGKMSYPVMKKHS